MNDFDLTIEGKVYGGYTPVLTRDFKENELSYFEKYGIVTESDFSLSVKLSIKGSKGYKLFDLSPFSQLKIGDTVDISNLQIVILKKDVNNPEEAPLLKLIEKS